MSSLTASITDERLSFGALALLGLLKSAYGSAPAPVVVGLSGQERGEILDLAGRHGVSPLLHRALQAGGLLDDIPAAALLRLNEERRATALNNLGKYGEFRQIARALQARGIPCIALKGLHLAELVYRDISLRPMSDMDILVPHSQLGDAVTVLQAIGYGTGEDLSGAARDMLETSNCNLGLAHRRSGTWLEVHWTLSEPSERYAGLLEDAWRSAVPARLGDVDAQVMSAEFLLLHVCLHLAWGHVFAFSLRGLCDIAEIVRVHPDLDWSVVVERARQHDLARGVAAALRLAGDHLGVPLPAAALTALGADALDPDMLADAAEHLITCFDLPDELRMAPNIVAIAGDGPRMGRLALLWSRIFLSRAELALIYGVSERSVRIPLYYAFRLRDLVRRYAASAWALNVTDSRLALTAARHARLARWVGRQRPPK